MLGILPLPVGVQVSGLDLCEPLDAATREELCNLLARHQLLAFRDQALEPGGQIRVMKLFGNVLDERNDGKRYQYVSGYETAIRPGRLLFHSDNHHTQVPLEYLSLYGKSVDSTATPTLFFDNVAAYRRFSAELQERLSDAEVVTKTFFHLGISDRPSCDLGDDNAGGPTARHPVVWRHPVTAEPFVYLTELHCNHIVGMPRAESDALLHSIFDEMYEPDAIYEHHWRTGDLMIWNNRTVQHARGEMIFSEGSNASARTIRRVAVGPLDFSAQYQFSPEAFETMKQIPDNFYVKDT